MAFCKTKLKKLNVSNLLRISGVFLSLLLLSSCFSSKKLDYLQSDSKEMLIGLNKTEYLIQPNDVLNVKVQSRDPDQAAFFNITTVENNNLQANVASLFLNGYTVDTKGTINLAIVGEVNVANKTIEQIRDLIQSEIDKYLLNALVSVKMTSFKVSVLGDVKNPGTNYIYNTQATIFEALSAAGGDLNLTAKRKKGQTDSSVGRKVYCC